MVWLAASLVDCFISWVDWMVGWLFGLSGCLICWLLGCQVVDYRFVCLEGGSWVGGRLNDWFLSKLVVWLVE